MILIKFCQFAIIFLCIMLDLIFVGAIIFSIRLKFLEDCNLAEL